MTRNKKFKSNKIDPASHCGCGRNGRFVVLFPPSLSRPFFAHTQHCTAKQSQTDIFCSQNCMYSFGSLKDARARSSLHFYLSRIRCYEHSHSRQFLFHFIFLLLNFVRCMTFRLLFSHFARHTHTHIHTPAPPFKPINAKLNGEISLIHHFIAHISFIRSYFRHYSSFCSMLSLPVWLLWMACCVCIA